MTDVRRDDPSPADSSVEPWLRGPVAGVPALLQPVAHALELAAEDVRRVVSRLDGAAVWRRPAAQAAPIGFHVRHAAGSLDRLFTYARGASLDARQRDALKAESVPGDERQDGAALAAIFLAQIEAALAQLRATSEATLTEARTVGRRQLPSTVIGLLFHAAEHTQRHVGQIVTTARVLEG